MSVVVLAVIPIVQDKAWVLLVQYVVQDMVVVQGMVVVVVGDFEDFVTCFVVPLVTTQNYSGSSNLSYMY